ncbi:MAG TPA: ferritin-like domain-containing protein [Solirubrobacterales bacterium]|nr:ferritin-like domain-containing protein [Solirubrobacterales bacterium]
MAPNRIMRGVAAPRALLLLVAVTATFLAGCGSGGDSTTAVRDKEADAEILNEILSRQTAAVEAYGAVLPALRGRALVAGRLFRAQEQEHIDGVLKALRGLGEEAEPLPEPIAADELKSQADYLSFFYEIESATIEAELSAVNKLTAPSPRSLLAATAANQAQHLVLLRQALGAKPHEWVPSPFENGTTPAP